jgi:geranylgeranyl diphosphate synthase type II
MEDLSRVVGSLLRDLNETKPYIDNALAQHFAKRLSDADNIDPAYTELWKSIQSLVLAGGKRLRPFILLSTYTAYTEDSTDAILPAALSAELIHQAMLIHDDIIDRDNTRYGIKNISGSYLDHYQNLVEDSSERKHYASVSALLAGDLMISDAYQLLSELNVSAETLRKVQAELHNAIFGVVAGEFLDTEAAFKKLAGAHPHTIATYKTASYSFVMPLMMGATLSNASSADRELLREFGLTIGIAYQMRDDILGTFGDSATTGKSTEGDIREGKRTAVTDEFLRRATDKQKVPFHAAYGNVQASTAEVEACRTSLRESGAVDAIEAQIEAAATNAQAIISRLSVSDDTKTAFGHLTHICLRREK